MSDIEKFTISKETRSLASRIEPLLNLDSKGAFDDKEVFNTIVRQDGMDPEDFVKKDVYVGNFVNAMRLASGNVSKKFMDENKDTNITSGSFEIGRSRLEVSYERHRRVPNRVPDKDTGGFRQEGEKDVYGDSTVNLKLRGAKGSKSESKAIRDYMHELYRPTANT